MAYDIPILVPTAPEGFCSQLTGPDWPQVFANFFVGRAVAQMSGTGFTVILNQEGVPGINDIDKLWRQPSTAARGLYSYISGAWIIPHPSPAGGNERRMWVGTLVGLRSFDGGDGTATVPAGNVGAMWEEDTDFQGRSPMGPGAIPTATPAKTLAVIENYGEGSHTQTDQELAAHDHPLAADASIQNGTGVKVVGTGIGAAGLFIGLTGPPSTDLSVSNNTFTTTQQPMPVIHPVRGVFVIRRSARVNYVGS